MTKDAPSHVLLVFYDALYEGRAARSPRCHLGSSATASSFRSCIAPAASASTDSVDGSCARSSGCMASLWRLRASSAGGQLAWQLALPLGALPLPAATPGDLPRSRAVVARTAATAFSRRGRTTPGSTCAASEVVGGGHSPHTPAPPPWASAGEDARLWLGLGLGLGLW